MPWLHGNSDRNHYPEAAALPTVSWRRGHWDSALHYQGEAGRTLCGIRIPADLYGLEAGDGLQCDRCAAIAAARPRAPRRISKPRPRAQAGRPISPITGRPYPAYLESIDYPAYDESQRMAKGQPQ